MSFMQPATYFRKLRWLFHYLGPIRGIAVALAKPLELAIKLVSKSEWYWRFVESQFDAHHGVDTYEIVPINALGIRPDEEEQAVFYEPSPIMEFGYLISRLGLRYEDYAFVDMGSGKGRALLLSSSFPFKRIVGVEISKKLHEIALENIQRFRSSRVSDVDSERSVDSICCDAADFEFPDVPLVLFLFNPFHEQVTRKVLDNLQRSFEASPRHIVVLYSNPMHHEAFEANSLWLRLTRTELRGWFHIYETSSTSHFDGAQLLVNSSVGS